MPEISRFYGIIIKMYFDDHLPPHFHAEYGKHTALIHINTLAVVAGKLPPKALGLVVEWASQHQEELQQLWDSAQNMEALHKASGITLVLPAPSSGMFLRIAGIATQNLAGFGRLLKAEGCAEALRNAQFALKAQYPHPCYWGAFMCQGDPAPLTK